MPTTRVDAPVSINAQSVSRLLLVPDMVVQYATWECEVARAAAGLTRESDPWPHVRADTWHSVNGQPFQRWIDPEIDLCAVGRGVVGVDELPRGTIVAPRLTGVQTGEWEARIAERVATWTARGYRCEVFADYGTAPTFFDKITQVCTSGG